MKTELVKIEELRAAEYNPRVMPAAEMEKLKRSIAEFGFVEPVVVNQRLGEMSVTEGGKMEPGFEYVIVGGHQRVEAARQLGMTEVPVVFVHLDAQKEKTLNLALNRIQGSWDEDKLTAILVELETSGDLSLTGFDGAEIDTLLTSIREERTEDFDTDKAIESIGEPKSKPGEVYELGRHRLMCGDSTDAAQVAQLVAGRAIDMVFTDPPYNVGYKSRGKNREKWGDAYGDDDYSEADFDGFCNAVFGNVARHLKKGGAYYVCSGWSSWSAFWRSLCAVGLKPRGCVIWDKGHGSMGWSDYSYQQEMLASGFNTDDSESHTGEIYDIIAYGFDDHARHYFAHHQGRTSDVWRIPREPVQSYRHPTQKPVKLIENALYNSSKPGDAVLDLFGGSGSTLIASEKTGRTAYLMERSPLFCDVIRKRYEEYAGKTQ